MTTEVLLKIIESAHHSAEVGLASSYRQAVRIASSRPHVVALRREVRRNTRALEQLVRRSFMLTGLAVDPRYEHPYDAVLLTYLVLLSETRPSLAVAVAARVQAVSNLWWAKKLANLLLTKTGARNEAKTEAESGGARTDTAELATFGWPEVSFSEHVLVSQVRESTGTHSGESHIRLLFGWDTAGTAFTQMVGPGLERSIPVILDAHGTAQQEIAA